ERRGKLHQSAAGNRFFHGARRNSEMAISRAHSSTPNNLHRRSLHRLVRSTPSCHPCQPASAGGSQGTAIHWERSYSRPVRNLLGLTESQRTDRGNRGFWLLRQVHCPAPARAATRGDHTYEFAAASQSVWRTIKVFPYNFSEPHELEKSLRGIDALINTYWVRFDNPPHFTFAQALANSKVLFDTAKRAGVSRVVHISITNPDRKSRLPYFRGKAELEDYLKKTGISYAILRPAVLFGKEDILINNIAWALRRLPVFGIYGSGQYRLQPIYVDDLAVATIDHITRPV